MRLVTADALARINATRETPLEGALVCEDGKLGYPVRNGIPVLLRDEAIRLSSLSSFA